MKYTTQIKVLIIDLFHSEDYTVLTIDIVYLRKYVLILKHYKNLGKGGLQRQKKGNTVSCSGCAPPTLCCFVACGS